MDYEQSTGGAKLAEYSPKQIPLLEKLKRERAEIQKELDEYDDAIKALEANPEFEKLINTLGKVNRIY